MSMEVTKIEKPFRFCTYENYDGIQEVRRHYYCSLHEYCCTLGCCVSTPFTFYQLWYFWLLLLLIIVLCSGGGWWFRWRHGGFTAQNTPTSVLARRQRRLRSHGQNAIRVYPHQHPFYAARMSNSEEYPLPPGYDKDPPSYNEVINHLSLFPRADVFRREAGGPNGSSGVGGPSSFDECQLALPPPSYEMVLDLKRRELEYQREISEAEQAERLNSARRRIRNLLGKIRNITTRPEEEEVSDPPPLENLMSPQDSYSTTAVAPNGLFTISRENLPPQEFYTQASTSSDPQPSGSSGNAPVSESDISQHFENSSLSLIPEASRRSPEASPVLPSSPPAFTPSAPPAIQVLTPDPQEREEFLLLQHAGTSRPFTGRSVLSRPTTSISTRTLSTPPELVRKTSLPGTVLENDEDKNEDETNEEQPAGGGGILAAS